MLYKDNVACITQIKKGYIKSDESKHISLKLVYTYASKKVVKLSFEE